MTDITTLQVELLARIANEKNPRDVLKDSSIKTLYAHIPTLPDDEKKAFGQKVNELKKTLEHAIIKRESELENAALSPIDVTAPWDSNTGPVSLLPSEQGTIHPISREIAVLADIFERMGFAVEESREIDDQYHMFESLNFPSGHPARDDYDTFMTVEKDKNGEPLIAPAHTSTMQHRILKKYRAKLQEGESIAAVAMDRCFRNEDLDARHEHTFYQHEGIFVGKDIHAGMLVATLREFLSVYYEKSIEVRVNPFYFPFTEPSFEFALSCPFCEGKNDSCKVCSGEGWIELLGCGMIHPNVLKAAEIDPAVYTGFAWGGGIERLIMMKYGIEDIRHFESGKLDFLRQF